MYPKRILLPALMLVAAGLAGPAAACSCLGPPSLEDQLTDREVIVLATVKSIEIHQDTGSWGCDPWLRVTLNATEYWVGEPLQELEILTPEDSACCGYHFEVGESYLVFADRSGEGYSETGLCIGNRKAAEAETVLEALGPGVTPVLPATWGGLKSRYGDAE